ncbi:MAG: cobalamin-binding protein [Deltaproteobacteria bacterium]|nr:MAG: cobalamin-binding protein [Deltaproteobacteria bacterium]
MKPPANAQRIVSLVPSLTEALFDLGLGPSVVGVTDWCVHPAAGVADLAKVGGTKNPSIARVLELRPDLVIANREENRERDVERLRAAGVPVWVTYPRTVAEGVALVRELAQLGAPAERAQPLIRELETALEQARAARPGRPTPVFCAIWKHPWMAVGADTYADDLLALCGGRNVFAHRRERRYPIVSDAEIAAAQPEVILLPDEPYAFGACDVAEVAALATPASAAGRIHCIDGTLISWYGPRIARALAEVGALLGENAPGAEPG